MKKLITHIWDAISAPFLAIAAFIDESRRQNLDGSWDKYWANKNCRDELRQLKAEYKQNRKSIKDSWRSEK